MTPDPIEEAVAHRNEDEMTWTGVIRWTQFPSDLIVVSSSGWGTPQEAKKAALAFAIESGWTPRRWWQFWRWRENHGPD